MSDFAIDYDRLAKIKTLKHGAHKENSDEMCAMEAVAYVAGEPWSDHPQCACPVIGAFMRAWNDAISEDADRTRLLGPLIPRLVGTRGSTALEVRRSTMAADWLIRTHTVAWLRLAKLDSQADLLAALPEIAAWAAAWAAARADLSKTTEELQTSVVDLIDRMIRCAND